MRGRFALYSSGEQIAEVFDLDEVPDVRPHYNVAPTQTVPVIKAGRELALLKWGLVPLWAEGMVAPINAQAETAATKPYFRSAFKKRRCLMPADGWYEWEKLSAKQKQPYFYGPKDGNVLAFAGLWESCERNGGLLETFTILTTTANELAAEVHNRMQVILGLDAYDQWLDPENQDVGALPNRSDSLGIVLLEAWANGVSNLASRAGGIAWVLRHGEDGLLARCGDVGELAGALTRLAAEAELRRFLGRAGQERVRRQYQWPEKLQLVRDLYQELSPSPFSSTVSFASVSRIS
jgi:putative SOS response-associated peptidase YedK